VLQIAIVAFSFAFSVASQGIRATNITPSYGAPLVAKGFTARIVASGLTKPRGMVFDKEGNLLVVTQGKGITALKFKDDGGICLSVEKTQVVIPDTSVSHCSENLLWD
jgi:hypothetical protein